MRRIRIVGSEHANTVDITDVDTGEGVDDIVKVTLVMETGLDNLAIIETVAVVKELDVEAYATYQHDIISEGRVPDMTRPGKFQGDLHIETSTLLDK